MRSMMDELFSPIKYSGYMQSRIGSGTKDDPFKITKHKLVEKVYHGWYDEDGSYHEVLVRNEIPEAIQKDVE